MPSSLSELSSECSSAQAELDAALQYGSVSDDRQPLYSLHPSFIKERETTPYLTNEEALRYVLRVSANGLLVDAACVPLAADRKQDVMFVMRGSGTIFVCADREATPHHSSLAAGHAVAAAGQLTVLKGRVLAISNESGHYTPPASSLQRVMSQLSQLGVSHLDEVILNALQREAYDVSNSVFPHTRPLARHDEADAGGGHPLRSSEITSHLSRTSVRLLAAESDESHEAASCQHAMLGLLQNPKVQCTVVVISGLVSSLGGLLVFPAFRVSFAGSILQILTRSKIILPSVLVLSSFMALVNSVMLSPTELSHELKLFDRSWHSAATVYGCAGIWFGVQTRAQVGLRTKLLVAVVFGVQMVCATLVIHARMRDTSLCMLPLECYLYGFLPAFIGMLCCVSVSEVFRSRRSLLAQIEEARRLDLFENGARSSVAYEQIHTRPPWPEVLDEDAEESD